MTHRYATRLAPGAGAGGIVAALRAAPTTLAALVAIALLVLWASDQAGYPATHWAPGGLIVLALLGVAVAATRPRLAELPRGVSVALACLAAYTALSFASILWASVPGDAWEGADRTLLYLLVFALFACWRQRPATAAFLLCAWTLAMVVLAGFVALHVDTAASRQLASLIQGGRLVYPSGYPNAGAAQWLMAFWPALLLARSARLPWLVRGALAGGAVLLADVALLSQSRGSLYSMPVIVALVFVLLPGRTRTFAVLAPVAAAIAATAPAVLRVGDRLNAEGDATPATMHSATTAIFAASVAVALVVALAALVEARRPLAAVSAARVHRLTGALAVCACFAVVVAGLAIAGDPVARVRHAWDTFKSPSGYGANGAGNRLLSGLGSNRYDFFRVAVDEFATHPAIGIGVDNFQQQYLAHGRSDETPRYPHSVELRTLSQTGAVGGLLALVGLAGALSAGAGALRAPRGASRRVRAAWRGRWRAWPRRAHSPPSAAGDPLGAAADPSAAADPLGAAVAAAALSGFAYWLVHGSVDWFWEFAGLGAPAFALLGIACSLAPRAPARAPAEGVEASARLARTSSEGGARWRRVRRPSARRALATLLAIAIAAGAGASLIAPWLSRLEVESAARVWRAAPRSAYSRLADAARIDPLGEEPYLVAGGIALRFDDLVRADAEFSLALRRVPDDAYATLERGAIASTRGQRARALALLARAVRLNPREPLARSALSLARAGRRVDVQELNRAILLKAQELA